MADWIQNFKVCCNIGKVVVRQSLNISFGAVSDSQNLGCTMDRLIYTEVVQCPNEGTIGKARWILGVIWQVWHSKLTSVSCVWQF